MITNIQELPSKATPSLVPSSQSSSIQNDTSDGDLIQRVALGDTYSMGVVYTRHSVRVYRFILRFIDNEAVAEEVVNEVFLDVWRSATKFEGRSQVSTWLLALARHKALAMRRRAAAGCRRRINRGHIG